MTPTRHPDGRIWPALVGLVGPLPGAELDGRMVRSFGSGPVTVAMIQHDDGRMDLEVWLRDDDRVSRVAAFTWDADLREFQRTHLDEAALERWLPIVLFEADQVAGGGEG